jgi:hypothetical protein
MKGDVSSQEMEKIAVEGNLSVAIPTPTYPQRKNIFRHDKFYDMYIGIYEFCFAKLMANKFRTEEKYLFLSSND